ncbi:unnamed protein product [Ectocarpus sp. 12 AP-2014]
MAKHGADLSSGLSLPVHTLFCLVLGAHEVAAGKPSRALPWLRFWTVGDISSLLREAILHRGCLCFRGPGEASCSCRYMVLRRLRYQIGKPFTYVGARWFSRRNRRPTRLCML